MKKKITLFAVCSLSVLFFSCSSHEIKNTSAKITSMTDTTINATVGEDEIVFNTKKASYSNGAVMPDDSVVIYYVGNLSHKKATAAVVSLIPPKGTIVEVGNDTSKELKTVPMTDEEVKEFDDFVEHEKQRRAAGKK